MTLIEKLPFDRLALDVAEVAAQLGLSRSSVNREIEEGRLLSVRVGRRRLVRTADLAAWLDAQPTMRPSEAPMGCDLSAPVGPRPKGWGRPKKPKHTTK